jgi:hypothetical protein
MNSIIIMNIRILGSINLISYYKTYDLKNKLGSTS